MVGIAASHCQSLPPCQVTYEGQEAVSRMVAQEKGVVSWGGSPPWVVAALRPLTTKPLEFTLYGTRDPKYAPLHNYYGVVVVLCMCLYSAYIARHTLLPSHSCCTQTGLVDDPLYSLQSRPSPDGC